MVGGRSELPIAQTFQWASITLSPYTTYDLPPTHLKLPWPQYEVAEEAAILAIAVMRAQADAEGIGGARDCLIQSDDLARVNRLKRDAAQLLTHRAEKLRL